MTPLLLHGDALTELRKLAAASVQACITSPPYLGMRKYNAGPGEIARARLAKDAPLFHQGD